MHLLYLPIPFKPIGLLKTCHAKYIIARLFDFEELEEAEKFIEGCLIIYLTIPRINQYFVFPTQISRREMLRFRNREANKINNAHTLALHAMVRKYGRGRMSQALETWIGEK